MKVFLHLKQKRARRPFFGDKRVDYFFFLSLLLSSFAFVVSFALEVLFCWPGAYGAADLLPVSFLACPGGSGLSAFFTCPGGGVLVFTIVVCLQAEKASESIISTRTNRNVYLMKF